MKTQQQVFAGTIELDRNREYAQRQAQLKPVAKEAYPQNCANARRSPLPSAGEIDRALERKYGVARYGQM